MQNEIVIEKEVNFQLSTFNFMSEKRVFVDITQCAQVAEVIRMVTYGVNAENDDTKLILVES